MYRPPRRNDEIESLENHPGNENIFPPSQNIVDRSLKYTAAANKLHAVKPLECTAQDIVESSLFTHELLNAKLSAQMGMQNENPLLVQIVQQMNVLINQMHSLTAPVGDPQYPDGGMVVKLGGQMHSLTAPVGDPQYPDGGRIVRIEEALGPNGSTQQFLDRLQQQVFPAIAAGAGLGGRGVRRGRRGRRGA